MPKKKDMIQLSTLPVFEYRGQVVADSRDVARMIGKRHTEVLRTIKTMCGHLLNAILRRVNFSFRQHTPTAPADNCPATT